MTEVLLYRSKAGQPQGYRISGHTGYAESGSDIVCSALSFLAISCANALEAVAGVRAKTEEDDGFLEVNVMELNGQAKTILQVFELGARQLGESYPEHVRVATKQSNDLTEE